ncbi:VPEID-CTERM sorting domain-containing protein [Antarcticimicrobium sediminis]|nr:VPEID-CTERM sorting domain-containing protein [Antarcticimicrobium sediminis]
MTIAASAAAFVIPAVSASAQSRSCSWLGNRLGWSCGGSGGGSRVPEIDASTGLLALAAVCAALALVWEIKRIRNKRG